MSTAVPSGFSHLRPQSMRILRGVCMIRYDPQAGGSNSPSARPLACQRSAPAAGREVSLGMALSCTVPRACATRTGTVWLAASRRQCWRPWDLSPCDKHQQSALLPTAWASSGGKSAEAGGSQRLGEKARIPVSQNTSRSQAHSRACERKHSNYSKLRDEDRSQKLSTTATGGCGGAQVARRRRTSRLGGK